MKTPTKFQVIYNGKTYEFDAGAKVMIFDYGLNNNMDKKSIHTLLRYVDFVYELYLKDDNPTPLGTLCDYIAENWKKVTNSKLSRSDILDKFYMDKIF